MNEDILEIRDISKEFPGVKALNEVKFNVKKGEVHALVGENGAGKSTLMKILSGVYEPTKGEIWIEGKKAYFTNPKDAQKQGVSIIHQEFSLIPYLNGVENIFLGREKRGKAGTLNKKEMLNLANEMMRRLNAENVDLEKPITQLSVANQQFIEIAKAISEETKVLIFDEPTASLTGKDVEKLFELIASLKERGTTIIYISHHLDEILEICDTLTCLRDGKWTGTKEVKDVTKQDIIKMMVGREVTDVYPDNGNNLTSSQESILEIEELENEHLHNISLSLKKGEILGVAGVVGAGRTELVRALMGADETKRKKLKIKGQEATINNPVDALKYGIGLIPENRKTQGLVLGMNVKNNITLPNLNKVQQKMMKTVDKKKEKVMVANSIKDLKIKTPSEFQKVKYLSGGNQQKVVLAKWLNRDCDILIFDEPTRGIDVGAKEEIYKLMRKLTDQGVSIIMISSELPEVLGMSDRVLVMYKGTIAAEIEGKAANQENVMFYATGGD
jgi:ribose transport system ATP-binding protein